MRRFFFAYDGESRKQRLYSFTADDRNSFALRLLRRRARNVRDPARSARRVDDSRRSGHARVNARWAQAAAAAPGRDQRAIRDAAVGAPRWGGGRGHSSGRRRLMRVALVDREIDVAALIAEVSDHTCGASTVFLGCVRDVNDGRAVTAIEYSAYRSMAERQMAAIANEAQEAFGVSRLVIEHRLGTLA